MMTQTVKRFVGMGVIGITAAVGLGGCVVSDDLPLPPPPPSALSPLYCITVWMTATITTTATTVCRARIVRPTIPTFAASTA